MASVRSMNSADAANLNVPPLVMWRPKSSMVRSWLAVARSLRTAIAQVLLALAGSSHTILFFSKSIFLANS